MSNHNDNQNSPDNSNTSEHSDKKPNRCEELLDAIKISSLDTVIMMDYHCHITFWNLAAEKIFGYDADEVMGKELYEAIIPESHRDTFAESLNGLKEASEGEAAGERLETLAVKKSGETFPVEISISTVDINGKCHAVGIIRDITKRKRVEKKLSDSLIYLQKLIDTIPSPVFIKDTSGRYQGGNKAWQEKIVGLPLKKIVGCTLYDFPKKIPEEIARKYHEEDLALMERAGTETEEHEIVCADGECRMFLCKKTTLDDNDGNVTGMVGVMLDITDRTRVEKEKRKLWHQFLQSQKMEPIGRLTGGIAHDFNNMLTGILGYSELALHDLDESHPVTNKIKAIKRAGERAVALTQQLLAFSRKQVLNIRLNNLNHAYEDDR
jgi:PAS domain S-box-containing protein